MRFEWLLTYTACTGLLFLPTLTTSASDPSANAFTSAASTLLLDELSHERRAQAIDGWASQLDSQRFTDRQEARRLLSGAGIESLPALERMATAGSREASTAVLELLEDLYNSSSLETSAQTEEVLKRISGDAHDSAAARIAGRILSGPAENEFVPRPTFNQLRGRRRNPIGQARVFQIGGRIQIGGGGNAPAGGLQVKRINVQNANGVRTISVDENGQKVTIQDDPNQGIEMNVSKRVEGRDITTRYRVANFDELKAKHPEAAQLYMKYSRQGPLIVPPAPQPAAEDKKS
jgi:hypothetical protein